MVSEAVLAEYLGEIRQEVCSRCVERPPGGPPCAPLGKQCGVEMHLPQLIETIHEVQSPLIQPYLEHNRSEICQKCAFLHSSICPCPMDYLAVLLVQAVETVDQRLARHGRGRQFLAVLPGSDKAGMEEIAQAYETATGRWTGCDWPTRIGKTGLDLDGWSAAEAESLAVEMTGNEEGPDWAAAATWLGRVERMAEQAEEQAALAVAAANAGEWREAIEHALKARALEFATGRPLWKGFPLTWDALSEAIQSAALAPNGASQPAGAEA
jgi:hypothetical protein